MISITVYANNKKNMLKYVSNTGGGDAVDFETAILDGFAADG